MADYCIPDGTSTVDGSGNYSHVNPGDRLLIPSSRTTILTFRNLVGTAVNRITVINADGRVTIDDGSWVGFQFYGCEHIHITGTGDPAYPYGFRFRNFYNSGIFCRSRSGYGGTRYIEIDHCEIGPEDDPVTGQASGIRALNDVADVPEGWIQYDTVVHHCWVHDIGWSGLYLGKARGELPTSGMDVYGNLIEDIGTEGIQITGHDVSAGGDECRVHHNRVFRCGIHPDDIPANPGAGIEIRHACNYTYVYKNYVEDARTGIMYTNTGDYHWCYNNVLLNCGQTALDEGGIFLFESGGTGSEIHVYNNTVMNSRDYGIKAKSGIEGYLEGNLICSTTSGNHIVNESVNVTEVNNQEINDCANAGLVNYAGGDYHITNSSPCFDGFTPVNTSPVDDRDNVPRPQAAAYDVGAYEFRTGLARTATGCAITTVVGMGAQEQCPP